MPKRKITTTDDLQSILSKVGGPEAFDVDPPVNTRAQIKLAPEPPAEAPAEAPPKKRRGRPAKASVEATPTVSPPPEPKPLQRTFSGIDSALLDGATESFDLRTAQEFVRGTLIDAPAEPPAATEAPLDFRFFRNLPVSSEIAIKLAQIHRDLGHGPHEKIRTLTVVVERGLTAMATKSSGAVEAEGDADFYDPEFEAAFQQGVAQCLRS